MLTLLTLGPGFELPVPPASFKSSALPHAPSLRYIYNGHVFTQPWVKVPSRKCESKCYVQMPLVQRCLFPSRPWSSPTPLSSKCSKEFHLCLNNENLSFESSSHIALVGDDGGGERWQWGEDSAHPTGTQKTPLILGTSMWIVVSKGKRFPGGRSPELHRCSGSSLLIELLHHIRLQGRNKVHNQSGLNTRNVFPPSSGSYK